MISRWIFRVLSLGTAWPVWPNTIRVTGPQENIDTERRISLSGPRGPHFTIYIPIHSQLSISPLDDDHRDHDRAYRALLIWGLGHAVHRFRKCSVYLASRAGPAGPGIWATVRVKGKMGAESHLRFAPQEAKTKGRNALYLFAFSLITSSEGLYSRRMF